MSRLWSLPALMLSLLAWGCTLGGPALRYWQDGKIVVYATDNDYDATKLGFDEGGAFLGLVSAPVTDVGSDATHVVVRQGQGNYFILTKRGADTEPDVEGPLTRDAFEKAITEQSLPAFSWSSKTKKPLGGLPWDLVCIGSFVALFTFCLARHIERRSRREPERLGNQQETDQSPSDFL